MSKHTLGPWFHDCNGSIWRRNPDELYQNGGAVAGEKPLATVSKGWYHDGAEGYPVEANARLIAAAPELLEALEESFDFPADFFECEEADVVTITVTGRHLRMVSAAIAKARGEA